MSNKGTPPSTLASPVYPVSPGSVLSQLIESTTKARFATLLNGTQNDVSSSNPNPSQSSSTRSRSKIPMKRPATPQNFAFERSLRQYAKINTGATSSPGTPRASRCSSPNPGFRSHSAVRERPRSRIPCPSSYKELHEKQRQKPPNLPTPRSYAYKYMSDCSSNYPEYIPAKIPYEPRPVKLGYGINQKTPTIDSNGWAIPKWSPNNEERNSTKKIFGIHEKRFSRNPSNLNTQTFQKLDYIPINPCTNCEHEERACQTISSEMLLVGNNRKSNILNIVDVGTSTDGRDESVCCCDRSNNNVIKRQHFLEQNIDELKKTVEALLLRNETLELQLFESKEKLLEETSKRRLESPSTLTTCDQSTLTTTLTTSSTFPVSPNTNNSQLIDFGINTEDSLREKLKFSLQDFILSHYNDSHEGDNEDTDVEKKLKLVKIALAAREGLLNELRVKLKKGHRVLQKRCDLLKFSPEDQFSSYKEITPPDADYCLHSYRKFVRFIHTYIEGSLEDIQEFDRTIESKPYVDTEMEVNGSNMTGVFIPISFRNLNEEKEKEELASFSGEDVQERQELNKEVCEFEETDKTHDELEETVVKLDRDDDLPQNETNELMEDFEDVIHILLHPRRVITEDLVRGSDDLIADTLERDLDTETLVHEIYFDKSEYEMDEKAEKLSQEKSVDKLNDLEVELMKERLFQEGETLDKEAQELFIEGEKLKKEAEELIKEQEELVRDGKVLKKISSIAAAKIWLDSLDMTPSSMANFILKPISSKLFDQDTISSSLNIEGAEEISSQDTLPVKSSGNTNVTVLDSKAKLLEFKD